MSISIFLNKEHQPQMSEVLDALGTKKTLWQELARFLADNYAMDGEWNFGGEKYGWNLWYRKSGKTLVTLYPQKTKFIAQIVLGQAQVEQALALKLGKNVRAVLQQTPQLHDGRWLFIKAKSRQDIKDIQKLLQIKRKPKPRTDGPLSFSGES